MEISHIGRYEIQRRLGVGGMGALYLARDPGLDRLVAIKLLKDDFQDDPDLRERFIREARSVARLRHPNIVIVHEVGEDDGRPFMAMEYIAGETLNQVLRRTPSLPVAKRLELVEDLCAGLAHAHAAGIIHRDIKPANIMLDGDGVLKILDFGIARIANSGMTQEGMMMGTLNYMSPEQVAGRGVDRGTDIFATGAVLYEVIALEQAFPGRVDSGILQKILSDGPVPLEQKVPGIDPDLAAIVRKALEPDVTRRYQDANALRQDLMKVRRRLVESELFAAAGVDRDTTIVETPKPTPAKSGLTVGSDRPPERFAERRRQQVEEHLRFGEEAFARGDHDAALQYAESAATVDPDSREAIELIVKARLAIDRRAIRQWLDEAQRLVADGHLDEAAALAEEASATLPDIHGAADLRREVRQAVEKIAAVRQREQRVASSLARAQSSLDQGAYDTALRAVYEALALDPDSAQARALEQQAKSLLQAEHKRREAREREAARRVEAARHLLANGDVYSAIAHLERYSSRHALVEQALRDIRAAVDMSTARRVDHNIRFTVYRPAVMAPRRWYPLLFFTHLGERRPDAPPDEPDPLAQVETTARSLLGSAASSFPRIIQDAGAGIPHEALLRIVPSIPDLTFNPPEYSFLWTDSVHKAEFKVRASASLEGQTARGSIDVRMGAISVALITVAIPIDARPDEEKPPVPEVFQPYRRIFASYSHKDSAIVRQFENFAHGIGDSYMRDVIHLRAGEVWNERLMAMIDAADVFQLFWSTNSMESAFVRSEWEHALTVRKSQFVRPLYWETPFPQREGLPPPELKARHFASVAIAAVSDVDVTTQAPVDEEGHYRADEESHRRAEEEERRRLEEARRHEEQLRRSEEERRLAEQRRQDQRQLAEQEERRFEEAHRRAEEGTRRQLERQLEMKREREAECSTHAEHQPAIVPAAARERLEELPDIPLASPLPRWIVAILILIAIAASVFFVRC